MPLWVEYKKYHCNIMKVSEHNQRTSFFNCIASLCVLNWFLWILYHNYSSGLVKHWLPDILTPQKYINTTLELQLKRAVPLGRACFPLHKGGSRTDFVLEFLKRIRVRKMFLILRQYFHFEKYYHLGIHKIYLLPTRPNFVKLCLVSLTVPSKTKKSRQN